MPLNSVEKRFAAKRCIAPFQCFDDAIWSISRYCEHIGKVLNTLMVCRVDLSFICAVKMAHDRSWLKLYLMNGILLGLFILTVLNDSAVLGWDVCDEGSSIGYVQNLHPATDPKHGYAHLARLLDERELHFVAFSIDHTYRAQILALISNGINISTSAQQQPVCLMQHASCIIWR